ncbi:MAG: sialidase family protein [Mariniphaga sp.]
MKRILSLLALLIHILSFNSCSPDKNNEFWNGGEAVFEIQKVFTDERFPNVVVAMDGSVIATWGSKNIRVKRSEDGGESWGPAITVTNPGFQGGGALVDESTGDILMFVEVGHPPAPLTIYRSRDNGKTWKPEKANIKPNSLGHVPSMHMNEHGITLKQDPFKGRLIRPSRYYGEGNGRQYWDSHYTNAIYSDDGGNTWQASEPFPAYGTGEAAIAELDDGTLYYNSRRHKSTDGLNPRMRHIAWSHNGGKTWENLSVSPDLPDGAQHTDYGLMAGLVRLPVDGYNILIFSNIDVPAETSDEEVPFELRTSRRFNGTIWASFDGGKSWPVKRVADEGSFAYSSLAAGREGTPSEGIIYLMYESDGGAKMARFNLAWLTHGEDWKKFIP